MSKKQCINEPSYTYTGKESSPLGLGYTAMGENVGTIKEGRDKTHWMVGMKNGVKVWNRVPTELAAKPLEKDEPVISAEVESAEAATPKKNLKKEEVPVETESKETEEVAEPAPEPVKKAPPKKRAPAKKKTPVKDEAGESSEASSTSSEKKPRKPTAFNIFMKYRMKTMAEENPGMNHKEKFANTAKEWKTMTDEQKAAIMAKAKEEMEA